MNAINATDVRKNFSRIIDDAVREKPQFIKRTRDHIILADEGTLLAFLSAYKFTADEFTEKDGSITLSLNELDVAVNGKNEEEARLLLAKDILEYANEFYAEFAYWSKAPDRKAHVPYIFKALLIDDEKKLGESIICQRGKN